MSALRKRYEKNKYLGEVYHGAIDLYANENDPVLAIEDGEVTHFVSFHLGTWGIFVKHKNVTVIYGEVSLDSLVFAGIAIVVIFQPEIIHFHSQPKSIKYIII